MPFASGPTSAMPLTRRFRLGRSLGLGFLRRRPRHRTLDGRQHHHHVPPIQLRIGLYGSKFLEITREMVQESPAQLGVGHLPAPEHDGDLDASPGLEEPDDVPLLDPVIVGIDLWAHLDLLDLDARLPLPGFFLLDGSLVLELAVVHDAANGGLGLRSHLDQVQVQVLGSSQSLLDRHDADLCSVRAYQPHLGSADPVVHTRLNRDASSPPKGGSAPRSRRSRKKITRHPLPTSIRSGADTKRERARVGPVPDDQHQGARQA